jgi:hypothetical protein
MKELTPQQLLEAKNWIKDCCPWLDLQADQVDEMTDREVIAGIKRHYDGGIKAFSAATQ